MRSTTALIVIAAAALVALLPAGRGQRAEGAQAREAGATATAYARSGYGGRRGRLTVSGDGERSGPETRVRASIAGGSAEAEASAAVTGVDLFDGLVTAASVEVQASATDGGTALSGRVTDLAIDGEPAAEAVDERTTYDLAGYGRLVVLAEDGGSITGLRARLTRPYRGHPPGAAVTIAFASASARDASPAARTRPRRPEAGEPPRRHRRAERTERERRPRARAKRRRAPELVALETERGYVFPVHGDKATFTDDWGAPRRHTGRHEGNDVFAPTGTPVVAVADGVLHRVGTRPVPGNRLWLESGRGDTFFYAHLSAFAHDARNGASVKAGDVVGFVGSTGDAEKTPPHLHFEIHPRDGKPVDPYPFLRAWQERRDVPAAAWLTRYGDDPGSRPGALVVLEDFLEAR